MNINQSQLYFAHFTMHRPLERDNKKKKMRLIPALNRGHFLPV